MFSIPDYFKQNTLELHGTDKANIWLSNLPDILTRCARRWNLTLLPPFGNLSIHYVAPAQRADGTMVVLKASSPTGEFGQEITALHLLAGPGIVRLLEVDETQEVMLLERLETGMILSRLVPEHDEQATSILANVMKRLWKPVPAIHPFPTVEDWANGLNQLRPQFQGGYGPFPPRLVDEAIALFAELNISAEKRLLLHGDLHHENILQSGTEWRVIDPKGLIGDPGYETGAMFYNPPGWLSTVQNPRPLILRRVDQLAEELAMERARIRGWGLAQAVLSAWWSVEDRLVEPPQDVLTVAEILASAQIW